VSLIGQYIIQKVPGQLTICERHICQLLTTVEPQKRFIASKFFVVHLEALLSFVRIDKVSGSDFLSLLLNSNCKCAC
jgi:hypothetical protein